MPQQVQAATAESAGIILPGLEGMRVSDYRNHKVIASIYPRPFRTEESHCRRVILPNGEEKILRNTVYNLPAGAESNTAAAENVRLLPVYDTFVIHTVPETGRKERLPIMGADLAASLVARWSGRPQGAAGGEFAPGLMVIAGEEPTEDEVRQLIAGQSKYFTDLVVTAERHHRTNQDIQIGPQHRMAARWLNQHSRFAWYPITMADSTKSCFNCGASLPMSAMACNNTGCGNLVKLIMDGLWTVDEVMPLDPAVAERAKAALRRRADRLRKQQQRGSAGSIIGDDEGEGDGEE